MISPAITEVTGSHLGLASADLLEKIDRLFVCNVGEYVDLPQLVLILNLAPRFTPNFVAYRNFVNGNKGPTARYSRRPGTNVFGLEVPVGYNIDRRESLVGAQYDIDNKDFSMDLRALSQS